MDSNISKERETFTQNINKVVFKIGSSSLTHKTGRVDLEKMELLVRQIANIYNQGKDVIIVSSGAIAAGMGSLNYSKKPDQMDEKQACAAVGQCLLMHMYEKFFSEYGIIVGQILITKDDIKDDERRMNSTNLIQALLKHRIIPIVNENDAVATDEIKVGDNDTLSAHVCHLANFDCLVLLSDIDGLYTHNPLTNPNAVLIDRIYQIDDQVRNMGSKSHSQVGTGGMITKIQAAEIVMTYNKSMFIINASKYNSINRCLKGEKIGTLFAKKGVSND